METIINEPSGFFALLVSALFFLIAFIPNKFEVVMYYLVTGLLYSVLSLCLFTFISLGWHDIALTTLARIWG